MEKIISLQVKKSEENLETKLAKKAKSGDSEAFKELYKINKVYLYKIAYSYVKDEDKALDIIQECAYRGFLNINKLKNPKIFKTWITKILINVAIDSLKKEKSTIYLVEEQRIASAQENISIEEKLDLYKAIDILKEDYKIVIILKYFNDMTIEEISKVMNIPINTVKSHIKRSKEQLNKILMEDYLYE